VRGWLTRKRFRKDLMDMLAYTGQEHLLMTNKELRERSAGFIIKKFILKKFREKKHEELRERSALHIQRIVRGRQARLKSFYDAIELDKYPRILFLREQKPLFLRLLKELQYTIEAKFDLKYEDVVYLIKEDDRFDTLRVAEPDVFEYKWMPLIQFTKPTAMSRLRSAKHRLTPCIQQKDFAF
jgi:hypothetical protein